MSFRDCKRNLIIISFIISLLSCSPKNREDFLMTGQGLIKEISAELSLILKEEDLKIHRRELRKKFKKLTSLMIQSADYERRGVEEEIEMSSWWSDKLYYEILRISNDVDGGKLFLEELQHDMLDRLDVDVRKHQKQKSYAGRK